MVEWGNLLEGNFLHPSMQNLLFLLGYRMLVEQLDEVLRIIGSSHTVEQLL